MKADPQDNARSYLEKRITWGVTKGPATDFSQLLLQDKSDYVLTVWAIFDIYNSIFCEVCSYRKTIICKGGC
jgi:hypothetical protein